MWRNFQWLLLTACLVLFTWVALASGKEATVNVEVQGKTWKSIRLKNLSKGGEVTFDMQTNGAITVLLVDDADHRRAPDFREPLFSSLINAKISFAVTIPSAGNYYVVLDNRLTALPRSIDLTVRTASEETGGRNAAAEEVLKKFKAQLNKIFMFVPFPVHVKKCDLATAFVRDSGIVLCARYAHTLYDTLGDKERVSDVLLFALFHEVGHLFLEQWSHPFYENEEMADEFATATMVMLNMKQRVLAKAEFFATNPSMSESLAKTLKDNHHPPWIQRAENIRRWAIDPNLVRKWQKVLVPHMQTPVLRKLQNHPPLWADLTLVNQELANRSVQ